MVLVNAVNVVWQLQGQTGTKLGSSRNQAGSNRNQAGVINQIGVGQEPNWVGRQPNWGQMRTKSRSNRHFDGIMRVRAVMTSFDQRV